MPNHTTTFEFLLLEFSNVREIQIFYFFVFLIIYLIVVTANLLIITAIVVDLHLHVPMYFFLMHLAILDIVSISVALPKSMANLLMNSHSISFSGCVAQVFFLCLYAGTEIGILTIMAHDRDIAICNPLQYETIMHEGACIQMAASAWIAGILHATLHTGGTFVITFCSNIIHQFFCEIPQIGQLSCSDLYLIEFGIILFTGAIFGGCFIYVIITYVKIFATVLRMPSVQGRKKALSTCLPHVTVVSLFIFSGLIAYVRPPSHTSTQINVICTVFYDILPPLLNPFIYSMRNKEIKTAFLKLIDFVHLI